MVEVKIRKGELSKNNVKVDLEFDCEIGEMIWAIYEMEQAVIHILEVINKETNMPIHKPFIKRLNEHFKE